MADEVKHCLVKWDGDGPIPEDAGDHPEKYPQVSEVIRWTEGSAPEVTYRRA